MNSQQQAVIYLRVSTKEQAERGGNEGFSIPAQREACYKKAENLNAAVTEEFVDRGESAKSADRPELQRMLKYLSENPTSYVIVHKVDRLARNRADDVAINLAIQQAQATLISCTESIDETPSGMLLHGIMSSIAEFYSQNLANEVKKGSLQKAKSGGTVGKAPIGYLNTREITSEQREIRTVTTDEVRAPFVKWAFEAYASGEHSIETLQAALAEKGLTSRSKRHTSTPKPLSKAQVGRMLKDPYYTGKVRYKGIIYPGNHTALISQELFDTVQEILTAKNISGNRKRIHDHHLKGSLTCQHCGGKMFLSMNRNRHGTVYPYFVCRGRKEKTCLLPYVSVDHLVSDLDDYYRKNIRVTSKQAKKLVSYIKQELEVIEKHDQELIKRETEKLKKTEQQRKKLLNLYYEGHITKGFFTAEQELIETEERRARIQLRTAESDLTDTIAIVEQALDVLQTWPTIFTKANDKSRRAFNSIFFKTIYVYMDEETQQIKPEADERLSVVEEAIQILEEHKWQPGQDLIASPGGNRGNGTRNTKEPSDLNKEEGSYMSLMVGPVGLEPTTNRL